MSSAGIIAHSIFGGSVWFTGPVALNGAAGGSEDYYKRTEDLTDWSDAPIALPLGKTSLVRIMSAHGKVWMTFTAGNSVVSADNGDTWTECDVALPDEDVFFNGRVYVCGGLMSSDTVTWSAIPNLPADTRRFTTARQQDNLIVAAFVPGTATYFGYTFDDGATWTTVAQGGSFADEDVYSLTASNRTERINYSMNNVSPSTGISGFYTDDLFVTRRRDGGSYSGRYESKYGCAHLIQAEATDRLLLSYDGGWAWTDSFTGTVSIGARDFDYGNNQWGVANRVSLGPPREYNINYSNDGGATWSSGSTVYGTISSLTHVGRAGNCALFPPAVYVASSESELWQDTPDDASTLATRNWTYYPYVSEDGEYIVDQDSGDNMILYKKNTNGRGYAEVEGAFSPVKGPSTAGATTVAISDDNQYFAGVLDGSNGWWAFRRVGDVYTELTVPSSTLQFNDLKFLPGTSTLVGAQSTSGFIRVFTFSGDIVSGPYTSPSTGHVVRRIDPSHNGQWVIATTVFDDLRLLDVTDPTTSVPIIADSLLTVTAGGNCGVFFTGDDTGIITVSDPGGGLPGNIYYHSWDGISTIGAPTLLGTSPYRSMDSDLTQDGKWLFVVGDQTGPHAKVFELPSDGTSILSSYVPTTVADAPTFYITWMGV